MSVDEGAKWGCGLVLGIFAGLVLLLVSPFLCCGALGLIGTTVDPNRKPAQVSAPAQRPVDTTPTLTPEEKARIDRDVEQTAARDAEIAKAKAQEAEIKRQTAEQAARVAAERLAAEKATKAAKAEAAAKEQNERDAAEAKVKAAEKAEEDAARNLKFAKKFMADGVLDSAERRLKEIVAKWPDTAAAKEARELLKKIK